MVKRYFMLLCVDVFCKRLKYNRVFTFISKAFLVIAVIRVRYATYKFSFFFSESTVAIPALQNGPHKASQRSIMDACLSPYTPARVSVPVPIFIMVFLCSLYSCFCEGMVYCHSLIRIFFYSIQSLCRDFPLRKCSEYSVCFDYVPPLVSKGGTSYSYNYNLITSIFWIIQYSQVSSE